jgi:hypothetical protein
VVAAYDPDVDLLVLAWGPVATVGIWIFYAVLGQTVGLTDSA